jgi:cytochrome c-type biogenesis protein CcmI
VSTFLLAAAALAIAAVLPFVWWIRNHQGDGPGIDAARLAVLRDRRAELDSELADGRLDEQAHAQARNELEDLALSELTGNLSPGTTRWPRQTMLGVVIAVPMIAAVLYFSIGGHDAIDRNSTPAETLDLAALVEELAERMQSTPDELQGWMLLGRSSVVLGQYSRAIAAWREANRLAPHDPTVLANLAEALILDDGASLEGEAGIMLEQALRADADNPKALWYGGLAAERRGEEDLARARWTALLAQDPPEPFRQLIETRLGIGFMLEIIIEAGSVDDGFLFVTLHDPDANGAPLAATRVAWPATRVHIGDAHVMQPGTRLDEYQRFRVVVRWSADADAARRTGDRWGETFWSRGEPESLRVALDHEVD